MSSFDELLRDVFDSMGDMTQEPTLFFTRQFPIDDKRLIGELRGCLHILFTRRIADRIKAFAVTKLMAEKIAHFRRSSPHEGDILESISRATPWIFFLCYPGPGKTTSRSELE